VTGWKKKMRVGEMKTRKEKNSLAMNRVLLVVVAPPTGDWGWRAHTSLVSRRDGVKIGRAKDLLLLIFKQISFPPNFLPLGRII
jgi:hypothetical protein